MEQKPTLWQRAKSLFGEGSWRGPFYGAGEWGGLHAIDPLGDGWQRNLNTSHNNARHVAPVYACVMLHARAVSQCIAGHMVDDNSGGFKKSTTSPASRIFRYPNAHETFSQLIFNTVAELLFEGECIWVAGRDERNAIVGVQRVPRKSWTLHIEPESKAVFYAIGDNILDASEWSALVPARDVVHFRQHCPRHALIGESPVRAAALAIGINVALNQSQLFFFNNLSRPSGIISTDQQLQGDQIARLKESWTAASAAIAQGKVPVLTNGLKFSPMSIPQNDQQLIEQQKYSLSDIARVFGVPVALLSENTGTQGGTEAMISHWLSVGLGSVIETIERSLDRLFNFGPSEHVKLDPTPLLRVDFASRIEGLSKAVQMGILRPNEVREQEGYGKVEGGDSIFLQQQMVPAELLLELHTTAIERQVEPTHPEPEKPEEPAKPEEPDPDVSKALVVSMMDYKRKVA